MKKRTFLLISALTLGALVSCGTENPGTELKDELKVSIKAPSKTTLEVDEELQLEADVKNNTSNLPLTWKSKDPSVASISSTGLLKGLKKGTTEITLQVGEVISSPLTITIEEKVLPIEVAIVAPESNELIVGTTLKLTSQVKNNVDNLPLTWNSSDKEVATVDENGQVTALKAGKTSITLTVGEVTSNPLELVVKSIEAETIEIQLEKNVIGVGEVLDVNALITPDNVTDPSFVVKSSNELKVRVDGHKIEGISKTAEGEKVTITVETPNKKTASVDIEVVDLSESVLPSVQAKLEASKKIESEKLVSGKLDKVTSDASGGETESNKHKFEVFSDSKTTVEIISKSKYSDKHEIRTYGLGHDKFIDITQQVDKTGAKTYKTNNSKEIITEGTATYGKILKDDATKMSSLVDLNGGYTPDKATVSYYVLNQLINNSSGFSTSDAKKNLQFAKRTENDFTLSTHFENYSNVVEISLDLKFDESGLLTTATNKVDKYQMDYDSGAKGDLDESTLTTIELTSGTRRESTEVALDFTKLAYNDYTPFFTNSYSGTNEVTEFNVGDKGYLLVKNGNPQEAFDDFDEITIKEVSDPDAVTIGYGNTNLTFKKACKNLEITTISTINKVEKKFNVNVNAVSATSISFPSSLHSNELVGNKINVAVTSKPTGSEANIEVKLENNLAEATATMVEGSTNEFVLVAKKAGTVDVIVVDKNLGETKKITKTVTFHENSDVGIAQLIANSTVSYSGGSVDGFDFNAEPGKANGTFMISVEGSKFNGTFSIINGAFSASLPDFGENSLTSFRLYKSGEYHRFIITYEDSYYDSYTTTITLK